MSLTTPFFFTSRNIGNVFSQTAVIAVLALGQLLVIITRGIDLSVGSIIALSSVVGAIVYQHVDSSVLVILAILGTGVAVGAANGLIFVFGRVPHAFIVTLASAQHRQRDRALGSRTDSRSPGCRTRSRDRRRHDRVAAVLHVRRPRADARGARAHDAALVWGRWLYAVGGNPDAARRIGVPVRTLLMSVYVLSGFAAGVGGLITAGLTDTGSPTSASSRSSTRSPR